MPKQTELPQVLDAARYTGPGTNGRRVGAVRGRSQTKSPNGNWVKRDTRTGRFMDQKVDGKPFKGVTKEK